ncbi:hypothetical protein CF327_g1537 [Tilletia walkeri]|nr:hypothetical protein CF327_g1537 [Tilletia walkeri]
MSASSFPSTEKDFEIQHDERTLCANDTSQERDAVSAKDLEKVDDSTDKVKPRQGCWPTSKQTVSSKPKTRLCSIEDDDEDSFPDGGFEAWAVVLGGAIAMCVSFGAVTSFAVFQEYYAKTILADRSQSAIAWIGSVQLMLVFGMTVPSGYLLTWAGPKVPMILGTIFLLVGTMTASVAKNWTQLFLSQGIAAGIGEGLIMLPVVSMPTEWFFKKRSFVSGLVAAGSALGGVILPIAINRLLNTHHVSLGWTLRIVGLIQLCGMMIATLLVKQRFHKNSPTLPWKIYFASRSMNFLLVGSFLMYIAQYIPYLYITVYGVQRGAAPSLAFYFTAVLNGGAVIGRLLVGSLADTYGPYNALVTMSFLSGVVALIQTKAVDTAGIIAWAFVGCISGSLQSLFTPAIARLAPSPTMIGGFVGIGCTLVSPALLASQPIAGALLALKPEGNDFMAQSIFTGLVCMTAAVSLAASRAVLPEAGGWKRSGTMATTSSALTGSRQPKKYAFVTLLTSDEYLPGALVVAHSLREAHARKTQRQGASVADNNNPGPESFDILCLVTPHSVRIQTIKALCASAAFDRILGVEPLSFEGLIHGALDHPSPTSASGAASVRDAEDVTSVRPSQSTQDLALAEEGMQGQSGPNASQKMLQRVKQNLQLLGRPDLGSRRGAPLSKLHAWRLTQYEKVVFLDADTLVLQPLSHLFSMDTSFAAAPDIGWPDAFNSGVLVLKPSLQTFSDIRSFAAEHGSWDGADQGLLNDFYGAERGRGEDGPGGGWDRLSFKYNVTPNGGYTYAPAYRRFGSGVQVAHFIGEHKPWHRPRPSNPRSGPARSHRGAEDPVDLVVTNDYETLIRRWHDVFSFHYPLPTSVDRHSSSAYSVEVIHSARGVEIIEREGDGGSQALAAGKFAVPTYEAVWNAFAQDQNSGFRPGQTEDLKSLFAGGAALYGRSADSQEASAVEAGLGKYASFPLDGRTSLIPPEGLPTSLLAVFEQEEKDAENERRHRAEEEQRNKEAHSAQYSQPQSQSAGQPHHYEHQPQTAESGRPWSPPMSSWNPAREPPPKTGQDTTFEMPAHYNNAWDVRATEQNPRREYSAPEAETDAKTAARRVPQHLMDGMYSHLGNRPPDASKVRAVFPWEQRALGSPRTQRSDKDYNSDRSDRSDRRRKIQAHAAEVLRREAEQRALEAATHRATQERSYVAMGEFDGKPVRRATRVFPDDPPRMAYAFQSGPFASHSLESSGSSNAGGAQNHHHYQQQYQQYHQHHHHGGQHGATDAWLSNVPALSELAADAEAAEAEVMATSPPAFKRALPPKLGYSNVWDAVGAIGDYADTVQAAQSPGPGGPLQLLSTQPSLDGDAGERQRGSASKSGKSRGRSGDRRSESRRRAGALGMEMGEYAGGSGSGEGDDSRDGDDESSSEEESGEEGVAGKRRASSSSAGPAGYGYGPAATDVDVDAIEIGDGIAADGGSTMVVGALGLTDEQFPEVLTVENPHDGDLNVSSATGGMLFSGTEEQSSSAMEMNAGAGSGSASNSVRRRRAESRGYLRKAEATVKSQVTASPRSPRNHGLRGGSWGGGPIGNNGSPGTTGADGGGSPSTTGTGSYVASNSGGGDAGAGDFSQTISTNSSTTTDDGTEVADSVGEQASPPLSGRARIRPIP